MKLMKKLILLTCILSILPLYSLTPLAKTQDQVAVAAADDYEFCFGLPEEVDCNPDEVSFRKYQGELVSIDPVNYDPSLTRTKSVREFIQKIVNYALSFLGLIAVLLIIYAGVMYLTAGGETEKTDKAKKTIGFTVIGLLLILGSYAIVNTILTGPFDGDGAIQGEVQGWAATGFNADTQAILEANQNILEGYVFFYESFETMKTLKSESEKSSFQPANITKPLALQYLSNVRAKIQNLKYKTSPFSQANSKMNNILRALNNKIDEYDNAVEILDFSNTIASLFAESGEMSLPELLNMIKVDFAGDKSQFKESFKDLNCPMDEFGYPQPTNSPPSFRGILGENACALKEVYGAVAGIEVLNTTGVPAIYDNISSKLVELSGAVHDSAVDIQGESVYASQSLKELLFSIDDLVQALKNVQFVQAKLVANKVEGSAPLIVQFNVLDSIDPSGVSIVSDNIDWDLLGDGYDQSDIAGCNGFGYNAELEAEEDKQAYTNFCIYEKPGLYRASVRIKSSEDDKYGSGESKIDIKVLPPELKISAKINEVSVINYNEYGVKTDDKKIVSLTKGQAKDIVFDAGGTAGLSGQTTPNYIQKYAWDFGDGTQLDGADKANVKHTYTLEGAYTVKLDVESVDGKKATKLFIITIDSPAARISVQPKGKKYLGQTVTFDGSASSSDAGEIKGYTWKVSTKDGCPEEDLIDIQTSSKDKILYHEFEESGDFYVCLTVTDATSKTNQAVEEVSIDSQPPVALFNFEIKDPKDPSLVTFDGSKSYDPDGEQETLKFKWEVKGEPGVIDLLEAEDPPIEQDIRFSKKGDYEVTLTVTEDLDTDNTSSITKTVTITNTLDLKWGEDLESTGTLDEGEAEMEFKFESDEAVGYEINFGDGETETGIMDGGTATTKHIYTQAGKFDVTVEVYDEEDNKNTLKKKVFIGGGDTPVARIIFYINGEEYIDYEEPVVVSRADMITFSAAESKNTDGSSDSLKYQWDFGDTKKSSKVQVMQKYGELSPKTPGYYTVTLKVYDEDDQELTDEASIKIDVDPIAPKFSSLQALPQAGQNLTTPVVINMALFGAVDADGKITQYKWWYFNEEEPDEILGLQITDAPYAILTIGTMGEEGDDVTYGFGVEVTDNDNQKVSSEDELEPAQIPTLEVTNGANAAPTAKFNVDRTSVMVGETVNFSSASTDPDGNIVEYVWDFEGNGFFDDEPTEVSTISHIFAKKNLNGYKAKLKVIDDKFGEAVSPTVTIYVDSNAAAPVAAFKAEAIGGKIVEFTNNSTADTELGVEIEEYIWDFDTSSQFMTSDSNGDGVKNNDEDNKEVHPVFEYDEFGTYEVKLTVIDTHGNESSVINTVSVSAPATATPGTQTPGNQGGNVIPGNPITTNPGVNMNDTQGTVISSEGGDPNSNFGLDTEPGASQQSGTVVDLTPVLVSIPTPESDGVVRINGDAGSVTFDFSNSIGNIAYYIFDKNIYFDTNQNSIPNDDEDFKTSLPGIWTTNFEKAWGKTVVKLTLVDIYGNKKSTVQEIQFK